MQKRKARTIYNTKAPGTQKDFSLAKIGELDKSRIAPDHSQYGYGGVYLGNRTDKGATIVMSQRPSSGPPGLVLPFNKPLHNQQKLTSQQIAQKKRFNRTALMRQRHNANKAHMSYDLDGDGVVGQRDMFLSSKFSNNGIMDEEAMREASEQLECTKDGLTLRNTNPLVELDDVVPNGQQPPSSALFSKRREEMKDYAKAHGDKAADINRAAHEAYAANLPQTYPWVSKESGDWGSAMPLDKITRSYAQEYSFNETPFQHFPSRSSEQASEENEQYSRESQRVGSNAYERMDRADWAHQRRVARGKCFSMDGNTRILALSRTRIPPTFTDTFNNIIGRGNKGGTAYAGSTREWQSTTKAVFAPRASSAMPCMRGSRTAHSDAKRAMGGQGVIRANHVRYNKAEFNNGNVLMDNIVGSSAFAGPHYMPSNSKAHPLTG